MTKLGLFGVTGLLVLGVAAACSGDDKAKKAQDDEAGAAGMLSNAGTGAQPGSGGSGTGPAPSEAGQGGQPVVEGGSGGAPTAPGGAGGMSSAEGGAGGAPIYDCPAEPGTFEYACALVASNPNQQLDNWSPSFDPQTNTFTLDVSSLPFPIASGEIWYIATTNDAEFCGSVPITVGDGTVSINVGADQELLTVVMTDFKLVDVCGQHHDYDPIGVACSVLAGSSEGSFDMNCEGSGSAQCPATCEIPAI